MLLRHIIILFLLLSGCSSEIHNAQHETRVVNKQNEMVKTKVLGALTLICSLKSDSLNVDNQHLAYGSDDNYSGSKLYLTFDFSVNGKPLEDAFLEYGKGRELIIDYLSNYLYRDVYIEVGADTLNAIGCLYPRQYGMNKSSTVLIAFNLNSLPKSSNFSVVYKAERLGLGNVRFPFTAIAIQKAASLHD